MRVLLAWPVAVMAGCILSLSVHPAAGQSSKSAPKLTAPIAPPVTAAPPPSSAIGTPMTARPAIQPLSPQAAAPLGGGSVRTDKMPAPSASSTSPSESAQSTAGGGGRTLEDCIKFWDRGTHMTKSEWRTACARSQRRLDTLKIDDSTLGITKKAPAKSSRVQGKPKGRPAG